MIEKGRTCLKSISSCMKSFNHKVDEKFLNFFGIDEQIICEAKITYDKKTNKFIERTRNIKLDDKIIGNIDDLNSENLEYYKTILQNSSQINKYGQISIGLLNNTYYSAIKGNSKNKFSKNLNVVNQQLARHFIGLHKNDIKLQSDIFNYLHNHISHRELIEAYAKGNLEDLIKSCFGKVSSVDIYKDALNPFEYESKSLSNEQFSEIFGTTNKTLSQDEMYRYFINFLATNTFESKFKARQLLNRGQVFCDSTNEFTKKLTIAKDSGIIDKNKRVF